jgi:hypothetical protein
MPFGTKDKTAPQRRAEKVASGFSEFQLFLGPSSCFQFCPIFLIVSSTFSTYFSDLFPSWLSDGGH